MSQIHPITKKGGEGGRMWMHTQGKGSVDRSLEGGRIDKVVDAPP